MARKVFYSFHYVPDNWRAAQVRNIGIVEGNQTISDNEREEVTKKGDLEIQQWINENLKGRSCTVVLIGKDTAGRKRINYEIEQSWNNKKGLVGIYIHNLKNQSGEQSAQGRNPFDDFNIGDEKMSSIVKAYNPPYTVSTNVYDWIKNNLEAMVEEAIQIRENY